MLCRIEACLSGRKNILRWGRLGSGNPGHRGRPLPVVRPHYRFSCAIGGAAFRLQSRDGEGRGGGLLAAAAGNDQSVSGEGPSLATSETYVTSYSSSFFATDGHGGAAFVVVFSFLFGAEKRNYRRVANTSAIFFSVFLPSESLSFYLMLNTCSIIITCLVFNDRNLMNQFRESELKDLMKDLKQTQPVPVINGHNGKSRLSFFCWFSVRWRSK